MMSDIENNYNIDPEISSNHSTFIEAIKQFDKSQRVKKPDRNEPNLEISEFHLSKNSITNQNVVEITDLVKSLGEKGYHSDLTKKLDATKTKANVILKPIEKQTAQKVKRLIGFENSKKELSRWTGIIARNRTAASVTFPLNLPSMKLESNEYKKQFHLQSDLEQKLAELEVVKNTKDKEDKFPLTLQEILERRKETAKFRAQQSYKEAKAYRQNKIKSKKFHRIQRKERIKKALKEFDELQKTDPYAALEKLDQLDRSRVKERMTLRHKNTGQWAKSKQIRAKYDNNSRQLLAEQLTISRDLTQKIKISKDSEEDDNNFDQLLGLISDNDNPWINSVNNQSEVNEFINNYQKYWEKINIMKNNKTLNEDDISKATDNVKENNVFKELKTDMHTNEIFIKQVTEKYSTEMYNNNKQISNIPKNDYKTQTIHNTESIKTFHNTTKGECNKKLLKQDVNIETFQEKSGTSSWWVSSIDTLKNKILNDIEGIDVDDIFEIANDQLQQKLKKKHLKLKHVLDRKNKSFDKREKKRIKNITNYDIEKLNLKGQIKLKPIIDKTIEETKNYEPNTNLQIDKIEHNFDNCKGTNSYSEIDPNRYINIKSKFLKTLIPNNSEMDQTLDNEDMGQFQIISEAFADDNVVDEFNDEKIEQGKRRRPSEIELSLPGWGNWGGKDINQPSCNKRGFMIKVPKDETRRDENKGNVIIIEEKCSKIKQHLVNELPFPFTSVQDFEANMRTPLGRNFVPEKVFDKLVQPVIKTKMGKVIKPMTENMLLKTVNLKKKLTTKERAKDNKK